MSVLKNHKHERFAQELAQGKTADEAYVLAGYEANRGNASRLKSNESVAARVREILGDAAEEVGITQQRVLEELGRIGFADIRKAFTKSGAILPPTEWDDAFAASIAGVEVVTRSNEKDAGGNPVVEHVHKFRTWDKRAALVDIGKHLGMFRDEPGKSGEVHIHFDGLLKGVL